MVAIDTNVLVRLLVIDNKKQANKALNYIKKHRTVFISLVVLCETSWVLTTCYDFSKTLLIEVIEAVLRTKQFKLENQDIAWDAMYMFKETNADFSDCIIASITKFNDLKEVATFDKKAAHIPIFELI